MRNSPLASHFSRSRHRGTQRRRRTSTATLLASFSLAICCPTAFSQDDPNPSPPSSQSARLISRPLPLTNIRLAGELNDRYARATSNLLTRFNDRYSPTTFAASAAGKPGALWWDWPGDQIGRAYSVLHVAQGYGWPDAEKLRQEITDAVLPLQTAEGNFGPPGSADNNNDARIPSGNAFALRGLMDAYADTKDPRCLDAARKLARYFERIAPKWETRAKGGRLHEFYGHCLDGLVALYEQGGDRWALDLAERLAAHAGRTAHTHHSLSLCRGLIDLARVTGKREYLVKVEDYLAWCREHQTVTGGLPEEMPQSEQDEGCGLADWIVVNLMMFTATGQDRYLDHAEHTLVNHFFMNQFHTGGFGHQAFSQKIVGGKKWQGWNGRFGSENPGCCSFWGQWALGQLGSYIVTESDDAILINLYPSASITLPDRHLAIEISSDFPQMTKARIQVKCSEPRSLSLALRVPRWAQSMSVTCNNTPVATPKTGQRMLISRTWNDETTIDIEFPNDLRTVPWPPNDPRGFGLFKGPLCLGLPSSAADVNLPGSLPVDAYNRPAPDSQGRPQVIDPSGRIVATLEPIATSWTRSDVRNPNRWRVLFQTRKAM